MLFCLSVPCCAHTQSTTLVNRPSTAYYVETLKFNKKFKVRVAGDSQSANHAFCLGWKVGAPWAKSFKLLHTPVRGQPGRSGLVCVIWVARRHARAALLVEGRQGEWGNCGWGLPACGEAIRFTP